MLFAGIQERMHIVRLCLLAILSPIAVWNSGYDLKIAMNADETLTSVLCQSSGFAANAHLIFKEIEGKKKNKRMDDGDDATAPVTMPFTYS